MIPDPQPPTGLPVWDDQPWVPLPSLAGDWRTGSCVIGLGGSGLTLAEALLSRGESVVAIDAADVGAGAAGRNGGFLLAGCAEFYHDAIARHGARLAGQLYEDTLTEMERLCAVVPEAIRRVGSKRLAGSASEIVDCRAHHDALRADGWPVDWYEGADGIGIFLPTDGAFNPLLRCRLQARTLLDRGAHLFGRTPVRAIEASGTDVTIHSAAATIVATRVFVAVDGGLERIFPELVGRVRTARLQMLASAPVPDVTIPCPVYFRHGYEYWQQRPDGSVALGGFRDRGGESEWTCDVTPSEPVQSLLEAFLREQIGVSAPITHRWAGSVAYTPNGLPLVEQVRPGVWALGGYCGTGNLMGALAARAAVAAALDGDLTPGQRLLGTAWGVHAH